jgi:hydrogenase maturation protease
VNLVIGYGNPLRRDDAAGPEVARRIAALGLPDVDVIEAHQLLPEHAEVLSRAERAVFVDASVEEGAESVEVRRVEPRADASLAAHASDPAALLAVALLLFERAPEAWLVTIPGVDFGIGEGLSPETEESCRIACDKVRELVVPAHAHA